MGRAWDFGDTYGPYYSIFREDNWVWTPFHYFCVCVVGVDGCVACVHVYTNGGHLRAVKGKRETGERSFAVQCFLFLLESHAASLAPPLPVSFISLFLSLPVCVCLLSLSLCLPVCY